MGRVSRALSKREGLLNCMRTLSRRQAGSQPRERALSLLDKSSTRQNTEMAPNTPCEVSQGHRRRPLPIGCRSPPTHPQVPDRLLSGPGQSLPGSHNEHAGFPQLPDARPHGIGKLGLAAERTHLLALARLTHRGPPLIHVIMSLGQCLTA